MSDGKRPRRVAEAIRKHVAEALAKDLFDPRLVGLMVTRVEIGADLSVARVYVRALVPNPDAKAKREVEKAANRAAPTLRRGLGARLGMKKTPTLAFEYDSGQDAIDRIEALLGEIQRESGTPPK